MKEILERLVKTAGKLDEIGDIFYEGSDLWDAYCKGRKKYVLPGAIVPCSRKPESTEYFLYQ